MRSFLYNSSYITGGGLDHLQCFAAILYHCCSNSVFVMVIFGTLIVIYTYLFDIFPDIESNATGIHSVYREIFAPFALLVYL